MAAPAPSRGGVGWAILAVALAVPGFLFYNWWSHLKAEHDKGVAAKASKRLEGGVFQTPPATRLVNPISPSTAAAPGAARPAAGVAMAANGPAGAPPATPAPAAPAPVKAAAAVDPLAVSTAAATITLSRDPMVSPMDLVRIREEEVRKAEEAERIRREAEEAKNRRTRKREPPKEKPIERSIELQGIVATPEGATLAIVNGATVNEGESFVVEGHSAKVKVVRITASIVTFEYKKRLFKMSVNAE